MLSLSFLYNTWCYWALFSIHGERDVLLTPTVHSIYPVTFFVTDLFEHLTDPGFLFVSFLHIIPGSLSWLKKHPSKLLVGSSAGVIQLCDIEREAWETENAIVLTYEEVKLESAIEEGETDGSFFQ